MSSFKKRVGGQNISIKLPLGSKLSTQNGQLLISSGISSLDEVLGGGLPVGSLNLVLEDQFTNYSTYLLKYFVTQGISNAQPVCLVGGEDRFFTSLPGIYHYDRIQASSTPPKEQETPKEESDDLKIAWRYKNLPNLNNSSKSNNDKANSALDKIESSFCNRFDLTNPITEDILSKSTKHHFSLEKYSVSNNLKSILDDIKELLKSEFSSTIPTDPSQPRKVLRIAINSLGSPLYNNGPLPFAEVYQFLTQLKGLMRFSYATLMVTLPSYIYTPSYLIPIYHLFDSVISLDTFTHEQTALAASGHHGFFRLVKSPSINTIQPSTSKILQSNHNNFVFKLSRKQFTIEPYVLPPELGDSPASSGCSAQNPSQNMAMDILQNFTDNNQTKTPKRITSHLGYNNSNTKKSLDF